MHRILLERISPSSDGYIYFYGEFDSGSERTLAAWIRHASRTRRFSINPSGETEELRVAEG